MVLISHNNEFTSTCCNETWNVRNGGVEVVSAVSGLLRLLVSVGVLL